MRSHRQLPTALGAALATYLAVGCGTTVPLDEVTAAQQADGGLGGQAAGPRSGDPLAPGPVVGASGGSTTSAPRAGAAPRLTTGTSGPADGGVRAVGPRTPVKVGFYVSQDVGKALAAFGLNGLSSGDGPTQVTAAVGLVNRLGGLAGRTVQPVVFVNDPGADAATQQQAACDRFFVDNRVEAVVSVLPVEIINECSGKRGVPLSVSGISTLSGEEMRRYPHVALPNQIERAQGIRVLIPSLHRLGYFTPRTAAEQVKVALLTNGAKGFEQVEGQVRRELARFGIALTDTAEISTLDRASGEASSAVLRFQTQGVTHVVVVDDHGGPMTFFALAAQTQSYYPRLGLSSYEIPQIAADVLPPDVFRDAVGVGWLPTFDVGLAEADGTVSAPGKQCMAAMSAAGQDMQSAGSRGIALGVCDSLLALRAAWQGRSTDLPGFLAGLKALGTSYVSTLTPATDFRQRRDGAAQVRALSYDADCRCFSYRGAPFRP